MSTSPESSAATRVASDLIGGEDHLGEVVLGLAPPVRVRLEDGLHARLVALERKGPVPLALSAQALSGVAVADCGFVAPTLLRPWLGEDVPGVPLVMQDRVRRPAARSRRCGRRPSRTCTSAGERVLIVRAVGAGARSAEKITSSAVKGEPSWNFDALAQVEAPALRSSTVSQRSARPGMILRSLSRLVSPSITLPSSAEREGLVQRVGIERLRSPWKA